MDLDYLEEIKLYRPSKYAPPPEETAPVTESDAEERAEVTSEADFAPSEKPTPLKIKRHLLLRYIIKELFLYFLISFAFFFVVFFVNQILLLARDILRQRVPVISVIRLIAYRLPFIVAQAAPFATLLGFLMCLGRMATDNEILILRASGQRYGTVLRPVLVLGIVISVCSFVINDYFLPLGNIKFNRLRRHIVESHPAVEMESHTVKYLNNTAVVIGDVQNSTVSDLVFFERGTDGTDKIVVSKESQVQKASDEGVIMQFNMNNALLFVLDRMRPRDYDVLESQKVLLNVFDSVFIDSARDVAPGEMTSYDLWHRIQTLKTQENVSLRRLNSYKVEYDRKFSMPFGSFFFALLAFPLALVFGRRDGFTLGLIFGIIISVLYWAAIILGQMFGIRSGWNSFAVMWGPNLFIGLIGIVLYARLKRK